MKSDLDWVAHGVAMLDGNQDLSKQGPLMQTICEHIDFNDLARRVHKRDSTPLYGVGKIDEAFDILRTLPFSDGYLDSLRYDVVNAFLKRKPKNESVYVYLAFYGDESKAKFLKIGIASNVRSRLLGIRTGNPLPNIFTYVANLDTRRSAAAVEAALLKNMSGDGVHGEWIDVHGIAHSAVESVVSSLAEVATDIDGHRVNFVPIEAIV